MKTITAKGLLLGFVFLLCAAPLIWELSGWSMDKGSIAAVAMDPYEVRCRLLTDAMDQVGVCTPEGAARLWAEGLKKRSAALQYAVMTAALKAQYARDLEQTFPNWVTGMSSPWVDNYEILQADKVDQDHYSFLIRFTTVTSAGPAGDYNACLIVKREGDFWRLTTVAADSGLNAYTGFLP